MTKLPFMQFYPADYLRDTRCLSLAARGAWMDILCTLWNSPKRGKRTLTVEGWAGEIGKASAEVSLVLMELEANQIGKIFHENDAKITIMSQRMLRDDKNRKAAAQRKREQRDREKSQPGHRPVTHPSQPGHRDISEVILHTSEVISQKSDSGEEKQKTPEKSYRRVKTAPIDPPKSRATWEAYAGAYQQRYGVEPVRNQKTNVHLCQLVDRLGAEEAPAVAAFYLSHNLPFYVRARHPTNLLVQDAEGLRTQWATGVKATTLETKSAEQRDSAREQIQRVRTALGGA